MLACVVVHQGMLGHDRLSLPVWLMLADLPLQVHTVGVGVAIGQSCMLLSAGTKGKRFMLPHATGTWH